METKVAVIKDFKWRGITHITGSVILVPTDKMEQFERYVTTDLSKAKLTGKDLPHYCQPADCWCSVKTGKNYPDGCTTYKCEYQGRQS